MTTRLRLPGSRRGALVRHGFGLLGHRIPFEATATGFLLQAERAAEVAVKVAGGRIIVDHDVAQVAKSVGQEDTGWHVFEFLVRSRVGDRSGAG